MSWLSGDAIDGHLVKIPIRVLISSELRAALTSLSSIIGVAKKSLEGTVVQYCRASMPIHATKSGSFRIETNPDASGWHPVTFSDPPELKMDVHLIKSRWGFK